MHFIGGDPVDLWQVKGRNILNGDLGLCDGPESRPVLPHGMHEIGVIRKDLRPCLEARTRLPAQREGGWSCQGV